MKIATALQFQPRFLSQEEQVRSHSRRSPGYCAPNAQEELQKENPLFSRSVDCLHVGYDALTSWSGLGQHPALRAAAGGIAMAGAVWGTNKLIQGESLLDRIEGVGTLAMAADMATDCLGFSKAGTSSTPLNTALGLIHGGADVITGLADSLRGHRESDNRRLAAGLTQTTIGAGAVTAALVPSAAPIAAAVMLAAVAARQLIIGRRAE